MALIRYSLKRCKYLAVCIRASFCLLLCFPGGAAIAQSNTTTRYELLDSFNVKANEISVDNFGNYYVISDNQVLKFDRDGKYSERFEEVHNGKIGSLDVSNPFKILVYYPDFLKVVILDKFMTFLISYDFFSIGYQNVSAVGTSADGNFWFYDNVNYLLKKIDVSGNVQLQSQPLNQLTDKIINPNFILEKNGQVFMNDPDAGILVFDNFGAYYKTIPIKGLHKFHILQEQIVYYQDNKLRSYNPLTFEARMISLPDSNGVVEAVIEKQRIAILKSDHVDFYRY